MDCACLVHKICGNYNKEVYVQSWAQFGGGHGGCVLPTFFSLGFIFGEVSKIKVMFVTFCLKSFSFRW